MESFLEPFAYRKKGILNHNLTGDTLYSYSEYLSLPGKKIIRPDIIYFIILTNLYKLILDYESVLFSKFPFFYSNPIITFTGKPKGETLVSSEQLISALNVKYFKVPELLRALKLTFSVSTETSKLAILSIFLGKFTMLPTELPLQKNTEPVDPIVVGTKQDYHSICEQLVILSKVFPLFNASLLRAADRVSRICESTGFSIWTDFFKFRRGQISGWVVELYLKDPGTVCKGLNDSVYIEMQNTTTKKIFTHYFGIFSWKEIQKILLSSFGQITAEN